MIRKIGIDFDNTIVCYDSVFYHAALEKGWLPPTISMNKTAVRDFFRQTKQEDKWTELQGFVYGARMDLALAFPGVDAFFLLCKQKSIKIAIISHKTKHPYIGIPYDLHATALNWLKKQSFFHQDIEVYFELTLQDKLKRITQAECSLFIDDLPELLQEPLFPLGVKKVLFDPNGQTQTTPSAPWTTIASWNQGILFLNKQT